MRSGKGLRALIFNALIAIAEQEGRKPTMIDLYNYLNDYKELSL